MFDDKAAIPAQISKSPFADISGSGGPKRKFLESPERWD
jgi:hypothetical protein